MAYTVQASFDQFYTSINLSGDHREIANTRKDWLLNLLNSKFTILDSFSTGSIPRYTAVKNFADVDIMLALHYGKHVKDKTPNQVLQILRDALSDYATTVRKNGQAVTIYFKSWPNVDVVPACHIIDSTGTIVGYEIPDTNTGTWIYTQPKEHTNNITERASTCGPNFRKLITMIKYWNKTHSDILQSFHLEVMAIKSFSSQMTDLTWDLFQYFESCIALLQNNILYEGSNADAYLNFTTRNEAIGRFTRARDNARLAWYYTYGSNSDHKSAIETWKTIFGDQFPQYG